MSDYFVKKAAYRYQENTARRRGIKFAISFEEWLGWWEAQLGSDWFTKRGKRRGQYVMARIGDKGAYELGNIVALKAEVNISQMRRRPERYGKLSIELAKELYQADGCMAELSHKYSVTYAVIYDLRHDRAYTEITKGLNRGKRCPCLNGLPCQKGFSRLSNTI